MGFDVVSFRCERQERDGKAILAREPGVDFSVKFFVQDALRLQGEFKKICERQENSISELEGSVSQLRKENYKLEMEVLKLKNALENANIDLKFHKKMHNRLNASAEKQGKEIECLKRELNQLKSEASQPSTSAVKEVAPSKPEPVFSKHFGFEQVTWPSFTEGIPDAKMDCIVFTSEGCDKLNLTTLNSSEREFVEVFDRIVSALNIQKGDNGRLHCNYDASHHKKEHADLINDIKKYILGEDFKGAQIPLCVANKPGSVEAYKKVADLLEKTPGVDPILLPRMSREERLKRKEKQESIKREEARKEEEKKKAERMERELQRRREEEIHHSRSYAKPSYNYA